MRRRSSRPNDAPGPGDGLDRRRLLKTGALGLLAWSTVGHLKAEQEPAAVPTCVLTPKQTEGPFYRDLDLMRSDLREDRPGVPLSLGLTVVDATTCRPLPGALVDLWHCDAAGIYSGFGQEAESEHEGRRRNRRREDDTTFLRGLQTCDGEGRVRFETIFPGWYPGRVTHVHVKIHLGERTAVTSQLYFPEDVTHQIYRQREPYHARGLGDTDLADDIVFDDFGGLGVLIMAVRRQGEGYAASHVLGVER